MIRPTDVRTAQALQTLGLLDSVALPEVAVNALKEGLDSKHLRVLAGSHGLTSYELVDLFDIARTELGLRPMSPREAAYTCARWLSALIVEGRIPPYEGAKLLWKISIEVNTEGFTDLDPFIYAASEYEDCPQDRPFFAAAILKEAHKWVATEGKGPVDS